MKKYYSHINITEHFGNSQKRSFCTIDKSTFKKNNKKKALKIKTAEEQIEDAAEKKKKSTAKVRRQTVDSAVNFYRNTFKTKRVQ